MLLSRFIAEYKRPELRRSTVAGHLVSLGMLAATMPATATVAAVKRANVLRMIEGGATKGLTRATLAKHGRYIGAAMEYAVRLGIIAENPARNLNVKHNARPKDWEYVAAASVEAVLAGVECEHLRGAIAVARWAGCRVNEVLRLQWDDVDLRGGTIVIHPTPDDWGRCEEGTKGRRRVVPLDPRVRMYLPTRGDDGYVCGSLRYRQYGRLLKRVATWDGAPWHTLRKSCGMDWADLVPISTVADWMGHTVAVASQYYLRPHAKHFAAITSQNPVNMG